MFGYAQVWRSALSDGWDFQIRLYLNDERAAVARSDPGSTAIRPIMDILRRHDATMKSQYDAFAEYVAEAEQQGIDSYPLYKWTRLTIDDPAKRAKHVRSFAIHVAGNPVYPQPIADALEAALQPLVEACLIERLSRHDTNPATNLPIPKDL